MPIIWVAGSLFLGYGDKNYQKFNAANGLISMKIDMLIREYLENCRIYNLKNDTYCAMCMCFVNILVLYRTIKYWNTILSWAKMVNLPLFTFWTSFRAVANFLSDELQPLRDSQQIKLDQRKLAAMRNAQSKVNERWGGLFDQNFLHKSFKLHWIYYLDHVIDF